MNAETDTWGSVITGSMQDLYLRMIDVLPTLVVAVLVLVFGWAVAILLGNLVGKILTLIKIDELAEYLGLQKLSERVGKKLSVAGFGSWLVKWFFMITAFVAAADLLGLSQVSQFLFGSVLPYFGNVIVAVAIMVIGTVAANFMQGIVQHSLKGSGLGSFEFLAEFTRWAIVIFAFLAALSQLDIASDFMKDLFRGIVAMLAIAGGLAFGLGGREHAKAVLDHMSKEMKK